MAGLAVLHDTPGRLRLRLPPAARAEGLEEAMSKHPAVLGCTRTPLTGNLLIHYRPGATTSQALVDAVLTHTGVSPAAADAAAPTRRIGATRSSEMARALRQGASELNEAVARLTGGLMDLRVVLPVALGGWALREIVRGQVSPIAWSTALWYAHGLFRDYNLPGDES